MFHWSKYISVETLAQLHSTSSHIWILLLLTIRGIIRLQFLRFPINLPWHETRVQTHCSEVSSQLWVSLIKNNLCRALFPLVLIDSLQQPYKLTSQGSIMSLHIIVIHFLKTTLKHLHPSKVKWMNLSPRESFWVQPWRWLLFKAMGMLANIYIPKFFIITWTTFLILHSLRSTYLTTIYMYQVNCMRRWNEKVLPAFLDVVTIAAFSPHMEWDADQYRMYHR